MRKLNLIILISLLVLAHSCKFKQKSWDVDMLTPIAKSTLSMGNLVTDSLLSENSDGTLSFINEQSLSDIEIGEVLTIPDTTLIKSVSLKKIDLGKREITRNITLGEIAQQAGFVGAVIIANHGKQMVIPPLSNISSGQVDVNAAGLFTSATFIDGKMEMNLTNGLPVDLTDIQFELRNKAGQELIIQDNIPYIATGATFTKVYSLAGKKVDGEMTAEILNMNSPGSGGQPVPIDTNDALLVRMIAYDMTVQEATAIFPAQNLVDDKSFVEYDMGDAKLKFMRVRSGSMKITASHNIEETMHLEYDLPGATKDGIPINVTEVLPPSKNGQTSSINNVYDLAGYTIDLSGKPQKDTFNVFYNELKLRIDSTGEMRHLSLDDSIYLNYGLYSIVPEYAEGYLGKFEYNTGKQEIPTNLSEVLSEGLVELHDINISLSLYNGIGASGVARIVELTATNSKTGKKVTLNGSVVGQDINIAPALNNPLRPTETLISLNSSNSNINQLLEILPDKLEYDINVRLNPNGHTSNYSDFIYYNSEISAVLNTEIPLHVSAKGVVLQDTVPLDQGVDLGTIEMNEVILSISTENYFPLEAEMQVYAQDANGAIIDSLLTPGKNIIHAGVVPSGGSKVLTPTEDKLIAVISKQQWEQLSKGGNFIIKARLATKPDNTKIKIYSSYTMHVTITANSQLRYTLKSNPL